MGRLRGSLVKEFCSGMMDFQRVSNDSLLRFNNYIYYAGGWLLDCGILFFVVKAEIFPRC